MSGTVDSHCGDKVKQTCLRPTRDARPDAGIRVMRDARQVEELKEGFISLVSHEMRTPLTVISGVLNLALQEGASLDQKEMRQLLKDAARETDSLSDMLNNLIEIQKYQSGMMTLHPEPTRVESAAGEAVDRIRPRASDRHRFSIQIEKGLPMVSADPARLGHVLRNLIENAVKFSPAGGEIRIFARTLGDWMVVGVGDDGVGISAADQTRLFRPFDRIEEKRPERSHGLGLGLLLCRMLVQAHGGRLWVESQPGKGSIFFFTLPLT